MVRSRFQKVHAFQSPARHSLSSRQTFPGI
jgi:hypothetical protein